MDLKTTFRWIRNTGISELVRDIIAAALASYLLFGVMFRIVSIQGASMQPTLNNGDIILMQQAFYTPERGDVVIVKANNKNLAKRIIGIGGDTITINYELSTVSVNGEVIDEPYIKETMKPLSVSVQIQEETYSVPANCVFVLGDNRNNSMDSRSTSVGYIDCRDVMGEALFSVIPPGKID